MKTKLLIFAAAIFTIAALSSFELQKLTSNSALRIYSGTVKTIVIGEPNHPLNGTPFPGVSIRAFVGDNPASVGGTFTDLQGEYHLQVPDNTTNLRFSCVGCVTQNVPLPVGVFTIDLDVSCEP
jgi:hypothetical protein